MNKRLFSLWGIALMLFVFCVGRNTVDNSVYENDEALIPFGEKILVKQEGIKQPGDGYLAAATAEVRFFKPKPQPAYVQQVLPAGDGYLSSLYILPPLGEIITEESVKKDVNSSFTGKNEYAWYSGITILEIKGLRVFSWRYQIGKTRLDHFLVFGKKNSYLFVSSPYGSNGSIEAIISKMKMK
ncbi:MAG: hypothetical protein GY754_13185 [bacterium]|nr:hypothetical protein [bacterium]